MQFRRINALKPNRKPVLIVDAGLRYLSAHLCVVEGMRRLESGARMATELERIPANGDQDLRGVCVRLTFGPELIQIDRACNFQESLRHAPPKDQKIKRIESG